MASFCSMERRWARSVELATSGWATPGALSSSGVRSRPGLANSGFDDNSFASLLQEVTLVT